MTLYRTHRPQKFADIIGQKHITQTLQNQIKRDDISHAYLFCGTRGTGKTSIAKIFARELNGANCDLDIFELDAASNNSVNDVRDIIEKTKYPPVKGKYKIYIVDEVHMFSGAAFNAFLKTLEEPPPWVVFILCTTEAHKLPKTVLSRCLRFDFRPAPESDIETLLEKVFKKEGVEADRGAIAKIARAGMGSYRDALSVAQAILGYCDKKITEENVDTVLGGAGRKSLEELLAAILAGDMKKVLSLTSKVFARGTNISLVIRDFLNVVMDSYIEKKEPRLIQIHKTFSELEIAIKSAPDALGMFNGACFACIA